MGLPVDCKLRKTERDTFDIDWDEDGDFVMTDGYETAVLCSLLGERRARSYEIALPQYRRGWIGNILHETIDDEDGCGNWLYTQSRLNSTTINGVRDESEKGLIWMIDDNIATRINVNTAPLNGKIAINASLIVDDEEIFKTQLVL